jgi:signal transduction histidine kinase
VEAHLQADGTLAVMVADTGPGLPPAVQAALYKPWVQAGAADRAPDGFGLGLSIVQALAQELGASLTVESTAAGTCFTLVLPAA